MTRILTVAFLLLLCQINMLSAEEEVSSYTAGQIQRGKQLVNEGRCNDCHTPSIETSEGIVADKMRILSGHPSGAEIPEIPHVKINSDQWIEFLSTLDSTVWVGEWGMSFAANITPDPDTGIGKWNEEVFVEIMKSGKHVNLNRGIKPPMPWQDYAKLSDEDLVSIFTYLSTIQPVYNAVPKPVTLPEGTKK